LILDWRNQENLTEITSEKSLLIMQDCPTNWDNLRLWFKQSLNQKKQLVIAWRKPHNLTPKDIWLTLVGISKYLSRTNQPVTRIQLLEKLGISDQSLYLGFQALKHLGFIIQGQDNHLQIIWDSTHHLQPADHVINQFLAAVREEQFQRDYFFHVPLSIIVAMIS
jgi:single-stranded-DNA-specific exonuclease